jgi:hypothetical protein
MKIKHNVIGVEIVLKVHLVLVSLLNLYAKGININQIHAFGIQVCVG